ncbi:MAG: M20 family metallopeptidase [Enterocloster sp.]|uniref:Peptidase M20 domain-containing protein 2 n=1 Tax=Enterocloster lavalensis TaxID=460384 RepID=A0A1I0HNW4_9FIRM|nr:MULTISPECIES: M20 family metallopeptidase [Enterocloster]MDR3756170.1 M20 family metallopeptidase [Enterocloster sp.]SET85758.1 amidohydrolase [Enterocloster lavalensis]
MKEKLRTYIDSICGELCGLSDDIFDHPECGGEERYAVERLTTFLRDQGFTVETGIAGLATAFRAVYQVGTGGPSIGLLCEYDALKGFGHGCGHHMQGPAVLGAAAALRRCLGEDTPAKIVVYGTPAEETSMGKTIMLREGYFRDIDIALMTHANPETNVDVKSLALRSYRVKYHGVSAHAAIKPEDGRSALDALMLACHGLECLREHVRDDVRMHYAIRETSPLSNVVPDFVEASFVIRSYSTDYIETLVPRLEKVLRGAAMMTETTCEIIEKSHLDSKVPSYIINDLIMENARAVDAPQLGAPREKTGSTDFGNVLHTLPGACVRIAFVPRGTSSHSQEYLDAGKSDAAHLAVRLAAQILALTSWDVIEDKGLLERIRAEFAENLAVMG